jgi:hypothetical protein
MPTRYREYSTQYSSGAIYTCCNSFNDKEMLDGIISYHEKFRIGKPLPSLCTTAATCVDTYFKSQPGQTIDHVIVDLGKLVQISSSTFNAYVALSYGKGRDTIRLRDLDNNLLARHSSKDLCEEELDWRNLLKR